MTAKSVVTVEVDSSQFSDFYALFQEYQQKLEEMPEGWAATGEAINDTGAGMEAFAESSRASKDFLLIAATQAEVISKEIRLASASNNALLGSLAKNTKAQKGFADEAERSNRALASMKKNADGVAHSIFGIGKWLLKLGAIGGGLAGLGGILSAISLKDLAASAVDTQRDARGLGMTPGQLTAFKQDFGDRYLDSGVLNSVANAQGSFTGQMWLSRATGFDMNQVGGMDPGKLAGQLALRAHDWFAQTPENMRTVETYQTTGLGQSGMPFELGRQEFNTPRNELERANSQYEKDQRRFNVDDKQTDAWYGFLRQIKDAGNTIETDLKNRLVALAPDLQRFIDVIGKDAKKLIDEIFTPQNLKLLEDGIDSLTEYLGSGKFKQDMKDFADLIGGAVDSLRKAAKFFNFGGDSSTPDKTTNTLTTAPGSAPSSTEIVLGKARHFLNTQSIEDQVSHLMGLDKKYGLPAGTLEAMWHKESGEGQSLVGPKLKNGDQAIGDFQFTSAAWKDWGKGGDRFSFNDESDAAGRYMSSLSQRYHGDIRRALAAYNWGPANVDKTNWESLAPDQTRDYVKEIGSSIDQMTATLDRARQFQKDTSPTNANSVPPMARSDQAKAVLKDDTAKRQYDFQIATSDSRNENPLLRKYSVDVGKTLATYDQRAGNLNPGIDGGGANWQQNLPPETQNYLNKILSALTKRQPQGFTVKVDNNTSARVAVQANAAAAQ